MIQKVDETIATIAKAMRDAESTSVAPPRRRKPTKSPSTRLHNAIVAARVKDSLGLEFFKDIDGQKGYDD